MTAKVLPLADASSARLWNTIDWKKVVAQVRQLQMRITYAPQNLTY